MILVGVVSAAAVLLLGGAMLYNAMTAPPEPTAHGPLPRARLPEAQRFKGESYTADFSTRVGPEFSTGRINLAKDGRKYAGLYDESGVDFTLVDLPPHAFVHVTFDLAVLRSWNGCSAEYGPDQWVATVGGGPTLLRTTFSNCGFFAVNNEQNYPDTFPTPPGAGPHVAWVGASEKQTLGFIQSWGPQSTFDCSAVYRMDWTFPHSDSQLVLHFFSQQAKRHDKIFGFMNFKVEPVSEAAKLTDAQLAEAWTKLAGEEAVAANTAVWQLIATGDQASGFLATKIGTPQQVSDVASNGYQISRVKHVLEVINTDAAKKLRAALPADPPMQ